MAKIYVSRRTLVLIIIVWFIAFSILSDLWPLVRTDRNWETVTHTQYGFSLDYPTKWKVRRQGEAGYRGDEEIKLLIYRSFLESFNINIRYRSMSNPTLADVVSWSNERISIYKRTTIEQGEIGYDEIEFKEDIINNNLVRRRTYQLDELMREEVYIARGNDMIIITLQARKESFENYLEDFEAILASFRPIN